MLVGSSKTLEEDEEEPVIARDYGADEEPELFDIANHVEVPSLELDSDDEAVAWEEVEEHPTDGPPLRKEGDALEIIIEKAPGAKDYKKKGADGAANRRPPPTPEERSARQALHKVHVLCLLAHGKSRNALLNDETLQARLMSLAPLELQDAFYSFSRQTHPNERERSRLFDLAMKRLISWWWSEFEVDQSLLGVRTRHFGEVQSQLVRAGVFRMEDLSAILDKEVAKGKDVVVVDALGKEEIIKNAQSLMKRAVQMKGSRDVSAQLFTSLCRALGIPARLVFSLQPVDWRATAAATDATPKNKSKSKKGKKEVVSNGKRKGKSKATTTEEDDSDEEGEFEEVVRGSSGKPISVSGASSRASSRPISIHSTDDDGEYKRPPVRLRKSKPVIRDRSASPDGAAMAIQPVFWTEVYSRSNKEWIPVDATRKQFRSRSVMEPAKANPHNKMLYVVGFEEDGYLRDVTPRYAKQFGAVTVKARVPSKKGEGDWWDNAIRPLRRPYALDRDVKEDAELTKTQVSETMPTAVGGFKDHPLYALERHLKREEVIHPRRKLGVFRNEEVFPRSSVIACRSAEQWYREGRKVKPGEQPLKMVKQRAVTLNKVRAQEAAIADGEEPVQQGLYARFQTDLFVNESVVDGKVPRNAFGNIDLYVPHMKPEGGQHLAYKGIAKVAKQLGVDYAEAVTGFDFHKRRAIPVTTGIVVADESAEMVLDAYWVAQHAATEKEHIKREERVMKRWKLLFKGLVLRERLQSEYQSGTSSPAVSLSGRSELANLQANDSEQDAGMDSDVRQIATSAPKKLSNTLRSLEKGHAGSSKRKKLVSGPRAVESSDEEGEAVMSEDEPAPQSKTTSKRKRQVIEIDSTDEDAEEKPQPTRRSKRGAKEQSDYEENAEESIATSRPRRAAAQSVSYQPKRQDVMSEDDDDE